MVVLSHIAFAMATLPCLQTFVVACVEGGEGYQAAMGKGQLQMKYTNGWGDNVYFPGMVTWAVEVPGLGLALLNELESVLSIYLPSTGQKFINVSLAPLSTPVGAIFMDGKVYVACFGAWDWAMSGVAVVDPFAGKLEAIYPFPLVDGKKLFVHNVYAFQWGGTREVFAAVLGNPWANPPVPGKGLVRFDRATGTFATETTRDALHARSVVQQSDDVFYALTQEPSGGPTQLVRLERKGEALAVVGSVFLPSRTGGDGGADVLLGHEPDTLFCTDRTAGPGKLYYYTFSAGVFQLVNSWETGRNPRYTTILHDSGDIVTCNRDDATLTTFSGLAKDPTAANVSENVQSTVPEVSFFMEVCSQPRRLGLKR